MVKVISLIVFALFVYEQDGYDSFGEKITPKDALVTESFLTLVTEEEVDYKVKGIVEEVCQMKGCWMTLKNDVGQSVRITFKDYGFFVPKDISGREVILEGTASITKQSEEMARHYAEDAGKPFDERMMDEISFVAKGVLVKKI